MKTIKLLMLFFVAIITLNSCTTNESSEEMIEDEGNTTVLDKNTIETEDKSGMFNYYTFTSYALSNGEVFDFTIIEKIPTSIQNLNYGSYIRIFIKNLPTQNTTYTHRPNANFDLEDGQYFFNNARIGDSGNQEWYSPFINTRTTAELKVTIENGVATFTIIDAELSDNFVAPINSTEKISVSFSINTSELTGTAINNYTPLAD